MPASTPSASACGPYREFIEAALAKGRNAMAIRQDLLDIIMRRYELFSTLLTSNRPVDDWGKLLGDVAAVSSMLDRLLHHGHVLKCGPRSWRTKAAAAGQ
jgi:DNA replication protein DnaC